MSIRTAILLVSLLLPLGAVAQQSIVLAADNTRTSDSRFIDQLLAADARAPGAGQNAQVVPVWASPDGRLLTIVALSQGSAAPTLPLSPSFGGGADFRVIDATGLFSAGLRWRIGHGLRADALIGQDSGRTPSNLSLHQANGSPLQNILGGTLGVGWTSADAKVDLSVGMSWLQGQQSGAPVWMPHAAQISAADLALMPIVGTIPFQLDSSSQLSARGTWQLEHGPAFDLTADVTRAGLAPVWYGVPSANTTVEQGSLGLGISQGALRGSVVGHVIRIDDPALTGSKRWSGIDLGVSWRTPWRGELSVGAQNLWSAPLDANSARESDPAQSRMPYVQYRQDL